MSLVTRCPSCTTTFKVVRDQLRISDGWVRCGRCSQVFDATADLRETPDQGTPVAAPQDDAGPPPDADPFAAAPPSSESEPEPEPEAEPVPEPEPIFEFQPAWMATPALEAEPLFEPEPLPALDRPPFLPSRPSTIDLLPPDFLTIDLPPIGAPAVSERAPMRNGLPPLVGGLVSDEPWPAAAPSSPPAMAQGMAAEPPWVEASTMLSAEDAGAPAPPQFSGDLQVQKSLRRARAKADKIARARTKASSGPHSVAAVRQRAGGAAVPAAPDEPVPSFLRPVPHAMFGSGWASSGRALWVGVAVAAVLLVLQVLRHERDTIVARQPAARPVFTALCAVTGCELSALREISAFTIDGASFTREKNGDGYRLSFTLRNAAALPLAMPAVELSLLDTQEQTLVRRVLTPAEFGAPPVLGARSDRTASLPLALGGADAAGLPPIAGYRMLAFYP